MRDKHQDCRLFNGQVQLILSSLLTLLLLLTAVQSPVRGARLAQGNIIFQLSGTLNAGDDINPKLPLYQDRKEFNYRLSATDGASGEITLDASNGGTDLVSGAAETGEVVWGTGALLNGTNVLTLANPSSVSVDFSLHLYELPEVPYTWEGSASPTGQLSTMRLIFPQDGLYTFDFTATGGDYQFSIDDDYVQKQVVSDTSTTFFVEAGTHTLEVDQGNTFVDWTVAVTYTGDAFDTLPYQKSGEDVSIELLPIALENVAEVNLVITATGTLSDSLYLQVYDTSDTALLAPAAQVYADETFWTTFGLDAGISSIKLVADGSNAAPIDYEMQIEPLPDPAYSWTGNAVATGDNSHARVDFPTDGQYTFDFDLTGGRFQFALDEDYILKTVDAVSSVTYYVPAGVHDLFLIQENVGLGASDWSVDVSLAGAGNDALPYTKRGGMGNGFTEEWLPVAMDAAGRVNLNLTVGGDPADDLVVEVYGPGATTPQKTVDAVLGSEEVWQPIDLGAGVNRLRLRATGNTSPITYALRLQEVRTDTFTNWSGRSLSSSSLHSSAVMHFSETGTYRFSLDTNAGFANLVLDGTTTLQTINPMANTTASYYDMDVTAGDHTLHVVPDPAFPVTEWTAAVISTTRSADFFNFGGTLEEGVTVNPEYAVDNGPLDFNFALTTSGDDVQLEIHDGGNDLVWTGTALAGETLWGTGSLTNGVNTFSITNLTGGNAVDADVSLTLYYLPEAGYDWEGLAASTGLKPNSHIRMIFPDAALYTFDFGVTTGSYQFRLNDDYLRKTITGAESVVYFVPAGTHDLYIHQDPIAEVDWDVSISDAGVTYDTLPYMKDGGALDATTFTEEWLPLQLEDAAQLNLATTITGTIGDHLTVTAYDEDDNVVQSADVYAGETRWTTFDLPAGVSRLHLSTDGGNVADLAYDLTLGALPAAPYTWDGVADAGGGTSHGRVTFPTSGLYTFTLTAGTGRFQFRLGDDFVQKVVEDNASVVYYIPAGTHDLYIDQDSVAGGGWNVAISNVTEAEDVLPNTKHGGELGGVGNDFDEAWMPVYLGTPQRANVELTVSGATTDALELEVLSGFDGTTSTLTLGPVYGTETVWATVDLTGMDRLRLQATGNEDPLSYTVTLHPIPETSAIWRGDSRGVGVNSIMRLDTPISGNYLVQANVPTGFASVDVNGPAIANQTHPAGFYYEFEADLGAGTHTFLVEQDTNFPISSWTVTVTLTLADPPTLTSVMPISITDMASTSLTLAGTNFMSNAEVRLVKGAETVTLTATYISATEMTAIAPAGLAIGMYDVVVENPDDQSATLTDGLHVYHPTYTYYLPLIMSSD